MHGDTVDEIKQCFLFKIQGQQLKKKSSLHYNVKKVHSSHNITGFTEGSKVGTMKG